MDMWGFINNTWFVGIVGGILSGLITTWIGRRVFSGKDKKEYSQKIEATNREIVYSLRSAISDSIHHDRKVILSLMAATARKNGVLLKDIYSIKEITEDLIKEVIDSSFIPSDYKKNFCETLSRIYLETEPAPEELITDIIDSKEHDLRNLKRNESIIATTTALVGIMVAFLTFSISFIQSGNKAIEILLDKIFISFTPALNNLFLLASPAVIALLSMLVVVITKSIASKSRNSTLALTGENKSKKNKKIKNENDKQESAE